MSVDKEASTIIERNRERLKGRVPNREWACFQRWRQVLFMHFQARPESLRALVPQELEIDRFPNEQGEEVAWVTMVPMHMVDLSLHGLPPVPGESTFAELNLRTYVTHTDPDGSKRHGIYFFRIDAEPWLADWGARHVFHLPYEHAEVSITKNNARTTFVDEYSPWFETPGKLRLDYRARLNHAIKDTPDQNTFHLAERYCSFTKLNSDILLRGDIVHDPWKLYEIDVEVAENSIWKSAGVEVLDRPPHALYSPGVDVVLWGMVDANIAPGLRKVTIA